VAKNIFSEDKGIIDDAFSNAADIEGAKKGVSEDVKETIVLGGVLLMTDCPYCGIQWRGIIKWVEISLFFLGRQVPNTQATRSGITMLFRCKKCGRDSPVTMTWDDVERYVAKGVKQGALPPTIYAAREQVAAERAKGQRR